ncbi:MAG: outer membrane beta-barrel protein [Candidatus Aminicenantales bacterium]|jgi:hypothetical protein
MTEKIGVLLVSALFISSVSFSSETKELGFQEKPGFQTTAPRIPRSPKISLRFAYGADLLKVNESISWTQVVYQENASYSVNYDVGKGHSWSVGLGYRFSDQVGIELGFDLASRNLIAGNRASIPHPLYFNSPREADSTERRKIQESAFSLDLIYSIPFGKLGLDLYAGPTYFITSAELTGAIAYTESAYPYDSISITPQTEKLRKNVIGLNAGSSVNLYLSKNFAVFITARYLWAKAGFQPSSGIPQLNLALGGLRLGGGLKLVF